MKRKFLALGIFSLCATALWVTPAKAWLFCSPWNCHNRYTTNITCRPYNAFTPICWGNLVCDGCCPPASGCAGGACMPLALGGPPCTYGYGIGGAGFMPPAPMLGGGCCASDMGMPGMPGMMPGMPGPMNAIAMPMQPPAPYMPAMQMPPAAPPMNPALPPVMPPGTTMAYPHGNAVSQASYYPNYYPAYYPPYSMGYNAYPPAWPNTAMPYYWYGAGR